ALDGKPFSWLPVGRSLFRDKRVPRENLNGLVVEKTGMAAALYGLTGIGGSWAQDPPYYAEVVAFETGPEKDWAHIRLADWRGWQHSRWIYFYHNGGPIVIVDEARGPAGAKAGLIWHLVGGEEVAAGHFRLRGGDATVEIALLPLFSDGAEVQERNAGSLYLDVVHWCVSELYEVAALVHGKWTGAEMETSEREIILKSGLEERISFTLPFGE
ncbi:MAG: hypothetical protein QXT77_04785, partial [Candidatus Methanomethylicaceae archaeon]